MPMTMINDASTDSYVLASWTSLFGSWPNSVPADLMTLTFDIADDATGMSAINFTTSSNAAGFAFDGQQHNVAVVESTGGSSDSSGATGSTESVVTIPQLQADTQHVYVSESTKSEDGTQAIIKVSYNADDSTTTGLGLRIHYDSSVFTLSDISDVLSSDLFIPPTTSPTADANDYDNDASTDSYVLASWTSLFGSWPNSVPADLMTLTFDIAEGATGMSAINFTTSSNAAGFAFDGQSHDVVISAESEPSEPESMSSQLSIDAATGVVTLAGEADYQTVPNYMFTVTAANGADSASQDVGLLVADYLVSADSNTYTGTDGADVFALADGSAQITSGAGADIFILAPPSEEGAESSSGSSGSSGSSDPSGSTESEVTIPELAAATQHVYVSESTKSEDGTQAIIKVSYNADDSTTTGLGLRIHYDSSVFTLSDISDVLSSDLFIPPTTSPTADTDDFDNDASTDSYVLASWTSLFGSWPNSVPADLMTLTFDIAEGATGMSAINFTTSSNAAGFAFDGQSHDVAVIESNEGEQGEGPIGMHTLVDFESGVDSIDASVALMALGYTGLSTALDGGAQQNKLSALTDVSADILELVSNNDTSLNNAFGSYFDDASNVLTLFVDTDASLESQMIETFEIDVGEGNTVEDDDLTVTFNTFIA